MCAFFTCHRKCVNDTYAKYSALPSVDAEQDKDEDEDEDDILDLGAAMRARIQAASASMPDASGEVSS